MERKARKIFARIIPLRNKPRFYWTIIKWEVSLLWSSMMAKIRFAYVKRQLPKVEEEFDNLLNLDLTLMLYLNDEQQKEYRSLIVYHRQRLHFKRVQYRV